MDARPSFDAPEQLLAQSEWLARLARGLTASSDDAADLAQDTLAAALAHPPQPGRPLRPWLARVAHNLAVRRGVGRSRREAREEHVARSEELASTADIVERVAMQRTVVEAVLALDEPYRSTLLLRYWDDLAPRDIAERMSVPVETVRTRLKRAIAQLRERLDRRHGGRDEWLSVLLPIALTRAPAVTASVTTAGLGSIGALLVSTPMKFVLVAAALVLAALVVQRAAEREVVPEVASAPASGQLEPLASVDAVNSPAPESSASMGERSEVAAATQDSLPVPNLERDIVCTVIDGATQAPIDGALVELLGYTTVDGMMRVFTSSATEAHGIAHLIDPRTSEERKRTSAAIDVIESNHAAASVVLPGLREMEDRQGPVRLTVSLVRGTAVRGRVIAADGRTPVAGASLRPACRQAAMPDEYAIGNAREAAISDRRGEFALDRRLAPPQAGATVLFALADGGIGWVDLGVVDGVEELSDVEVRLRPNAELVVTVTDAQARPIANAAVEAFPWFAPLGIPNGASQPSLGGDPRVLERFHGRTNELGVARFARLPVETDAARASAGSRYSVRVTASTWPPGRTTVALDPLNPTPVTIVLDARPTFTLRGTVTTHGGAPLGGARVSGPSRKSAFTDRVGHYEVDFELPVSRRINVTFDAPSHSMRTLSLTIAPDETRRTLDFEFPSAARIEGRIVDELGRPLAGFVPRMLGERVVAKGAGLATGADGTFAFEHVDQDPTGLTIEAPDDDTRWSGPFGISVRAADSPLTLQFRRLEAARVSLVVELVDAATKQPLAATEATLSAKELIPHSHRSHIVERTLGWLHATQLHRGTWKLSVANVTGARAERTIVVDQDEGEVSLRIELGSPGRIVGRVVFDDVLAERRPDYAFLIVDPSEEGQWIAGANQQSGNYTRGYAPLRASEGWGFRFDDVRAFDRVVLMLGPAPYYGRAEVSVPAGGEVRVELHAKLGGDLVFVRDGELKTSTAALTLRCEGESEPRETTLSMFDDDISAGNLDIASFTVPTGRVRWTIRYWSPASRDQPSVIEGEAQIAPGATVRAPIRF